MFHIKRAVSWGLVAAFLSVTLPGSAWALSGFLDDWRNFYSVEDLANNRQGNTASGNINCQLCHARPEGGEPWNAYGWDLRFQYQNNGLDIIQAFMDVESFNLDNGGGSNLEEINAGTQPGWEVGPVNTFYFASGGTQSGRQAPPTLNPFPEELANLSLGVELDEVATGFTAPLDGRYAPVPGLESQLFIADQTGLIWRVDIETGEKSVFLDFKSRGINPLGAFTPGGYDERGLLGLAFHPDYATNGKLYIHISEPANGAADFSTMPNGVAPNHQGVVAEVTIGNPDAVSGPAIVSGQRDVLRVDQPQFNHNGGGLLFDDNNYLLVSLGDGGGRDDEGAGHSDIGNASDPTNPFGAILRIDPLGGTPYAIPPTNPFVDDENILDEIYAYGFRNPWRLTQDTDRIYVADVGQDQVEEVSVLEPGMHHGWRFKEGSFFFDPNGDLPGIVTDEVPGWSAGWSGRPHLRI